MEILQSKTTPASSLSEKNNRLLGELHEVLFYKKKHDRKHESRLNCHEELQRWESADHRLLEDASYEIGNILRGA